MCTTRVDNTREVSSIADMRVLRRYARLSHPLSRPKNLKISLELFRGDPTLHTEHLIIVAIRVGDVLQLIFPSFVGPPKFRVFELDLILEKGES